MVTTEPTSAPGAFGPLAWAGAASLGAGAIHAAAVGLHGASRGASVLFALLAVTQLAWGAVALVRSSPAVAAGGVLLHGAALAGWVLAKTSGVAAVGALAEPEGIQWPDAVAAGLAAAVVAGALRRLAGGATAPVVGGLRAGVITAVVAGATLVGLTQAGGHRHGSLGEEQETGAGAAPQGSGAVGLHRHPREETAAFDPAVSLDLSGTPEVTAAEQADAEALLASTVEGLPRFTDREAAQAAGFVGLGDRAGAFERFVRSPALADGSVLDPGQPEGFLFGPGPDGTDQVVAALYLLAPNTRLAEAPAVGGPLTPWQLASDLCAVDESGGPQVRGVTDAAGRCTPPERRLGPVPVLHVWVTANRCGPFAWPEPAGASDADPCPRPGGR